VVDQSQDATSPTTGLHAQGPVRADHNINVPETGGYSQYGGAPGVRHSYSRSDGSVSSRDASVSSHSLRDVNLSISPRDVILSPRDVKGFPTADPRSATPLPPSGRTTPFRERLLRGEHFATDLVHEQDGDKLSTLV
jgi:hypothetical protein